MHKKLITACVALLALAAAVAPGTAFGSPELLTSGGVKVAVGTGITGQNVGTITLTTASGNISCNKVEFSGKVTSNPGNLLEATLLSVTFAGDDPEEERCTSTIPDMGGGTLTVKPTAGNLPWCLKSAKAGSWSFRGAGCAEAAKNLVLTEDLYSEAGAELGSCVYERTTELFGTYNVNSSPWVLTIGAAQTLTRVAGPAICPATQTPDGQIRVRTSAGGELRVS
jgi:hypothetical protein